MSITVAAVYRYPVKSLSAEALKEVEVTAGKPLPHDRRYAIAHGASRYDAAEPVGSSRVDLQACKLEYSIVSPK